jgi:hypothetical protein
MKNIISPFFFEEPTMAGENFLAMMEDFPIRWCTTSFSHCVHAFLDRKSQSTSLAPSFSRYYSLRSFLLVFIKATANQ